jgi:regulatory protein
MPTRIERIENAGPDRRARRLVFSDPGLEPRLTSAAVVRVLGLDAETEIEPTELEERLNEVELACARERALRVLGHRERSTAELRRRLSDDGYPEPVVAVVVARFEELQLVDDARFAALWVRTRNSAGLGPQRIRRELRERGVSDEIIREAMSGVMDADQVERARQTLGNRPLATASDRDRALRRLVGKGFDFTTARKAIDPHSEER